jgi:hypothetical protein
MHIYLWAQHPSRLSRGHLLEVLRQFLEVLRQFNIAAKFLGWRWRGIRQHFFLAPTRQTLLVLN